MTSLAPLTASQRHSISADKRVGKARALRRSGVALGRGLVAEGEAGELCGLGSSLGVGLALGLLAQVCRAPGLRPPPRPRRLRGARGAPYAWRQYHGGFHGREALGSAPRTAAPRPARAGPAPLRCHAPLRPAPRVCRHARWLQLLGVPGGLADLRREAFACGDVVWCVLGLFREKASRLGGFFVCPFPLGYSSLTCNYLFIFYSY